MLIENNETFLSEMTKLFNTNQTKGGSLYITMKRLEPKDLKLKRKAEMAKVSTKKKKVLPKKAVKRVKQTTSQSSSSSAASSQPSENKCLIRVHNSKRKISTIVSARDVNKFQLAYANLIKGNLYGLKKKDTKKKSGSKAKATQ
ncbi:unnamed protein product [Medioppia subpectinata]|uniref:Signal recognition particle 14 kDa protein n=1 Tax=Medioppia subpectinata TaxID=1979941 RepID=A0A7R9QJP4_9ACAR|nr:unnamed protein product [Medioppia subpectinata]CAG2121934.1 unnamed protein product [Medioppia subpectinata]